MIDYFSKEARKAREKNECDEAYQRGFNHAQAALNKGESTVEDIYARAGGELNTNAHHDAFDKGAIAAAAAFENKNKPVLMTRMHASADLDPGVVQIALDTGVGLVAISTGTGITTTSQEVKHGEIGIGIRIRSVHEGCYSSSFLKPDDIEYGPEGQITAVVNRESLPQFSNASDTIKASGEYDTWAVRIRCDDEQSLDFILTSRTPYYHIGSRASCMQYIKDAADHSFEMGIEAGSELVAVRIQESK